MIHHFDHRFGTYEGQTDAQAAQGKLPELTDDEHADPALSARPHYWVDALEVQARLAGRSDKGWLVGWRDITSSVVYRTVIASVIPRVAVGNNMPLAFCRQDSPISLLLASLDSFALDYVARQKLGGTHLNYFLIEQLPIPGPVEYRSQAPWADASISTWIDSRVLELVYTAWDMEPYARDHDYAGPPFRWDPGRRALLRAELDAAFFHLYGLERDDVDYVMDTFWVVRDRDMTAHGEYRTKRLILEIYDELAEAIATGRPYQTRLDPPPADPRVAHPPRSAPDTVEV
jgi:hypothetical protein